MQTILKSGTNGPANLRNKTLMGVDLCSPTNIIFTWALGSKSCSICNMTVIILVDICIETWQNRDRNMETAITHLGDLKF